MALWPNVEQPLFAAMLDALSARHRHAARRAVRAARRRGSGGSCCTARASNGSTSFGRPAKRAKRERRSLAVPLSIQRPVPGARRSVAAVAGACASRLEHLVDEVECSTCGGSRLRDDAAAVRFREQTIDESAALPLGELLAAIRRAGSSTDARAENRRRAAARDHATALQFLVDVGLEYLSLGRPAADALRTAKPSAFAWPARSAAACAACCTCSTSRRSACIRATTRRLLKALHKLRDLGNTLLVVEHDREVIENCRPASSTSAPAPASSAARSSPTARPSKLGEERASRSPGRI